MKQRSTQQAPRLQFTRDEQSDPVMKKPIRRAQRAADARDAAQAKLLTRKRLTVQDAPEAAPTPLHKRVYLTDEVKTQARSHHTITDSASMIVHERIREDEDENTAVQAVHEAEKASEAGIRAVEQVHHSAQVRAHKKAARAEKRLDRANVTALIAREQRGNPQAFSNPLSRWQQKHRIKKAYAAAKAGGQLQTARTAGAYIASAGRKAVTFVRKGISLFPFLLLAAMLLFVLTTVSACAPLAQTVMQAVVMTTYPAEEADVLAAEQAYTAMEEALAYELDHYGELHPEYQEVIVDADEIWHDPYALISIVSAYHNGEPWTIDDVYHTLETFFHLQYVVTESVESETRYRTEIVIDWVELYNPA
ncbi:MAG: peptidase M23, partial [Clostridia bacterium]|nr:peptidase M23 [Clostridia bacterium]